GNSIDVGTWVDDSDDGVEVRLGPFMAQVNNPSPMESEHIDSEGEFQSDKYPWCAPGFVPLKLTDPMAHAPLMAYAQTRASEDLGFATDLMVCLAAQGFLPAVEAVGMVDGKITKNPFSQSDHGLGWAGLATPAYDINPDDLGPA
ncbi:MAG: hypothetical protein V3S68_00720, partial [Dehalococcoidia bacterium]